MNIKIIKTRCIIIFTILTAVIVSGCYQQPFQTYPPNGYGVSGLAQSFTPGSLAGDRRLYGSQSGSGLSLRLEERQDANTAALSFSETLRSTANNTRGKKPNKWSEDVDAQKVREILADVLRQNGTPFIRIPAHAVTTYRFPTYCLDAGVAGPKPGEKFRLVPTDTVIPPQLNKAYQGLLQRAAASSDAHNTQIQGILWKLRHIASDPKDQSRKSIQFSQDEQQLLYAIDPTVLSSIQSMVAVSLDEVLIKSGSILLGQVLGQVNMPSDMTNLVQGLLQPETLQSLIQGDYQQVSRAIDLQDVAVPVPNNNGEFTTLSPSVTARAVSNNGGHTSLDINFANNGEESFFLPLSCVCASERPVQRLALQPPMQGLQYGQSDYLMSPVFQAGLGDFVLNPNPHEWQDERYFRKTVVPLLVLQVARYAAMEALGYAIGTGLFAQALIIVTQQCSKQLVGEEQGQCIAIAKEIYDASVNLLAKCIPKTSDDTDKDKEHRGVIQAQGDGYQDSMSWARSTPLTLVEGIAYLEELVNRMPRSVREARKKAIIRARRWMEEASKNGGVSAASAASMKSFYEEPTALRGNDPRIDIQVNKGIAFR